jgi:uncharacterized protein (TIGR03067 family)
MKMNLKKSPDFTALSLLVPCVLLVMLPGCATRPSTAASLQQLQGTWEGFGLGREMPSGRYVKAESAAKTIITITGDSLSFHEGTNFWYETTLTLPTGPDPQQLHATIKRCAEGKDSIGKVVIAFYKIEDGTLTLGGIRDKDSTAAWPKSFDATEDTMTGRYALRKVQPQTKNAKLPKSK